MQLNVEATFTQNARLGIKVTAVDMQTLDDRNKFEAGVRYWQAFQDQLISERIQKIKDLGLEPKKRGRPPKKQAVVVEVPVATTA